MTMLTIELDDELLARARQLAAARNTTVSAMLQRLLRIMTAPPPTRDELPPVTRQALGMLPPMSDAEVRKVVNDERARKHGA